MEEFNLDFKKLLNGLSEHISIKEIKKDYIFLASQLKPKMVGEYMGIKIYIDKSLPPKTIYLMRKIDYRRIKKYKEGE